VNRIERRAAAIPDTDGLWISKIWKAMLKVLRKVTEPMHTDWASFCKAIHTVTLTQINEAKEEEQEAHNLCQEVKDLHDTYNTLKKDITNMLFPHCCLLSPVLIDCCLLIVIVSPSLFIVVHHPNGLG
jgi:hypothetical protein